MALTDIPPRDRLIVGLDLASVEAAEAMVAGLGDSVTFYKIGYRLAYAGGLPFVKKLADQGKKGFVDLKLHDIGNTVAHGVESIAKSGATFLTVHAYPQTMKAAVEARGAKLKILAVTGLTSYDDAALEAAGYRLGVAELVAQRARQAEALGIDGLGCSPEEAASLRQFVSRQVSLGPPAPIISWSLAPSSRRPIPRRLPRRLSRRSRRFWRVEHDPDSEGRGSAKSVAVLRKRSCSIKKGRRKNRHGQRLLDRARRRTQRGWLKSLRSGQSGDLQQVRRTLCRPRRQVHRCRGPEPLAQCRDRIPGL